MALPIPAPNERRLNERVSARIRALLAWRGVTQVELAEHMGVTPLWLNRRLSARSKRAVSLNLDELDQIASALGVPVQSLLNVDGLPEMGSGPEVTGRLASTPRRHLRLVS